jgi:hypothetical protein
MVEGTQILRIDFDDPDGSRDEKLVRCRGTNSSARSTSAASSSSIRNTPTPGTSVASISEREQD